MPLLRPSNQFTKSLCDFLGRIPRLIAAETRPLPPQPRVPLVIRVGAAGPLQLPHDGDRLSSALRSILSALKKYADESANPNFHQKMFSEAYPPPAQLRLVCQLAAGFDQMAASAAMAIGYELHAVLPGGRAAFQNDIERNLRRATSRVDDHDPGPTGDPVSQFQQLLANANRVLELDRDDESSDQSPFTRNDYAQAGSIILDHSDVVVLAVHDEPCPALGGTRWMESRAEEKDLTVIRIPVERPFDAVLIWSVDGRREYRSLFDAAFHETNSDIFAAALDRELFGASFDPSKTELGWLERRMTTQLDPEYNTREWNKRWELASSDALARRDLGLAQQQIDDHCKLTKIWADHRASAMAELVRGSFILGALLGIVAVLGALIGILFPVIGYAGKVVEILCLFVIFWLISRSRRRDWRSQWLSLRQLERFIEQAAWLLLLGRSRVYGTPSHLVQFQTDNVAVWTNAYFRAVIRNCTIPAARFGPDYLKTVHLLALQNLVVDQISYFEEEAPFQYKSDVFLERSIKTCVLIALTVTLAYLFPPVLFWLQKLLGESIPGEIVAVLGAFLTSTAAALAAIRNHGEYAQIAARFEGSREALLAIQAQLAARLPDRRPDFSPPPLRSAYLASVVGRATDILIQEVQGWRAVLQKKEIEPT
jgi:hypothetical protein